MEQEVATEVRRLVEQAEQRRVGRPHKSISRHLRFYARSLVLEDRQKGRADHFDRRLKKEVADLLADEFGFSKNPTGREDEKGASRAVRRALQNTKSVLQDRLNWSDCLLFTGGDFWLVYFLCGFNPMLSHEYRYTPLAGMEALNVALPVNWYAVYHREYVEPTVNPDNPSEIGIHRRIDEVVECKPFYLSLPGINVP